jgi:hypothetical protein
MADVRFLHALVRFFHAEKTASCERNHEARMKRPGKSGVNDFSTDIENGNAVAKVIEGAQPAATRRQLRAGGKRQ